MALRIPRVFGWRHSPSPAYVRQPLGQSLRDRPWSTARWSFASPRQSSARPRDERLPEFGLADDGFAAGRRIDLASLHVVCWDSRAGKAPSGVLPLRWYDDAVPFFVARNLPRIARDFLISTLFSAAARTCLQTNSDSIHCLELKGFPRFGPIARSSRSRRLGFRSLRRANHNHCCCGWRLPVSRVTVRPKT